MCIYIHIYTHIYIYMHIYIYTVYIYISTCHRRKRTEAIKCHVVLSPVFVSPRRAEPCATSSSRQRSLITEIMRLGEAALKIKASRVPQYFCLDGWKIFEGDIRQGRGEGGGAELRGVHTVFLRGRFQARMYRPEERDDTSTRLHREGRLTSSVIHLQYFFSHPGLCVCVCVCQHVLWHLYKNLEKTGSWFHIFLWIREK